MGRKGTTELEIFQYFQQVLCFSGQPSKFQYFGNRAFELQASSFKLRGKASGALRKPYVTFISAVIYCQISIDMRTCRIWENLVAGRPALSLSTSCPTDHANLSTSPTSTPVSGVCNYTAKLEQLSSARGDGIQVHCEQTCCLPIQSAMAQRLTTR